MQPQHTHRHTVQWPMIKMMDAHLPSPLAQTKQTNTQTKQGKQMNANFEYMRQ